MLTQFLSRFGDCFTRQAGRRLLGVYVRGLLSDVQRKNVEAIAVDQNVAARTLQRFRESIKWDEDLLRHRCQRIIYKASESTRTKSSPCPRKVRHVKIKAESLSG